MNAKSSLFRTVLSSTSLGLLGGVLVLFLFYPPWQARAQTSLSSQETADALYRFQQAVQAVSAYYVEEVDAVALIDAAIDGMVSDLDPHSGFLSKTALDELTQGVSGNFGGLGIQIDMFEEAVRVVAPIDNTPAFNAGLKAGDLIVALDGEPVFGKTLTEAVDIMRGEIGTPIELTVYRQSTEDRFDVTIRRGLIPEVSVYSRVEGENVGYLRISNFTGRTAGELGDAIVRVISEAPEPLAGFIVDLRSNPGGALRGAIEVSDTFLDSGEIVSTRGRGGALDQSWRARGGDLTAGLPLVVLIDGGSASASEIVAAALQDNGRAIIMGQRSFGKGSVQSLVDLEGGAGLKLTTSLYYSPNGTAIQGRGVDPDIEVRAATIEYLDEGNSLREEDYGNSLNAGQDADTDQESDASQDADPSEGLEDRPALDEAVRPEFEAEDTDGDGLQEQLLDYQLERAIDLIQALSLAQKLGS